MFNKIKKQSNDKRLGPFKSRNISEILNGDRNLTRLFVIMIFVFVVMAILKPNPFLTLRNVSSMAFQTPEFGILSIAIMITMLTGGIDLSIVGIANLSGIMAAFIMVELTPANATSGQQILIIALAVAISICIGLLCGLFNGVVISKIGIPPILATLATMQLYMGLAIVLTGGKAVLGFPEKFAVLGNGTMLNIPVPMILFIIVVILISLLLNKTSFGMKLYMMGTNPIASKFSGIDNNALTVKTYLISGGLAAIAGLVLIARTNSAKADYGTSYTLQAVLVAVMGGVNPNGGFGKIVGIIMAMFTLQFLSSGFNAMHFSNFFKDFIWGAVLIVVMIINFLSEELRSRSQKKTVNKSLEENTTK